MTSAPYTRLNQREDDEEYQPIPDESEDVQIAAGAPLEKVNPLGRQITLLSAIMLNVGQMLGSGIYAVPGTVLNSVGSVGMLLLYWIISSLFAFAGLGLYSEYASAFPHRSGGEVAYLEQAYPRPKYLVSTSFAVTSVFLSFSATNAVVFAQYTLTAFQIPVTDYTQTITALTVVFFTVGIVAISTKWSIRAVNFFGIIKVISLGFMILTGIAVLLGLTPVKDPYKNFENLFEGTSTSLNALALGLVKTNYSYVGWHNAFNVVGEIRGRDPARTVRKAGFLSLLLMTALFLLVNVAYVAAVSRDEIRESGQLVAALFFQKVFGKTIGLRVLPLLVACSTFGNIIAVTVGQGRVIREIARQGLIPYPTFFASTKPFGTPLGPVALKGALTFIIILILPAKDAYNFIVDLASYPFLVFQCGLCVGIWILRRNRREAGLPPPPLQAKGPFIWMYLFLSVFLLVMPWVPPENGRGDVSFWYATYCAVGLGFILACGVYYYIWIVLLPEIGGYEIVEEVEEGDDGARNTRLVRRYKNPEAVSLLHHDHDRHIAS